MVKKAEGTDRAFFWGPDFSTQGYMKWTLVDLGALLYTSYGINNEIFC